MVYWKAATIEILGNHFWPVKRNLVQNHFRPYFLASSVVYLFVLLLTKIQSYINLHINHFLFLGWVLSKLDIIIDSQILEF